MNQEPLPAQGPVDVNVRPWFRSVKVGDMLHPIPLWNHSERGPNCLPVPVEVLDVIEASSQSGVLFAVRTKGGWVRNLDAAWFKRPNAALTGAEGVRVEGTVRGSE